MKIIKILNYPIDQKQDLLCKLTKSATKETHTHTSKKQNEKYKRKKYPIFSLKTKN